MPIGTSPTDPVPDAARIAAQNDAFRRRMGSVVAGAFHPGGAELHGRVFATAPVAARGRPFVLACLHAVAAVTVFPPEDDPDGLRDFGAMGVEGARVWWKIDLYSDDRLEWGSERPDDPARTYRVLMLLFPEDW
ncbi:DUF3768 domain-containing protein [Jannaschia rubra]|uniref:DUF3768 domain-containing protein n=1 Tax=Jannaschia rubra TaxID=282197 RepID=A0A0M6XX06_9RHOB|nr:DUF3768 domain-containing protein [Jannaschia rubra]CTQ34821.1 hypothetical protein JAN5088_03617 [Jannaschia rubra]SFG67797.1 Protein of unknown function [Jannaschia rubra]